MIADKQRKNERIKQIAVLYYYAQYLCLILQMRFSDPKHNITGNSFRDVEGIR